MTLLSRALPAALLTSALVALSACPQTLGDPDMNEGGPSDPADTAEPSGDPTGIRLEGATFTVAVGASIEVDVWAVDDGGKRVTTMPQAVVTSADESLATISVSGSEGGTTSAIITGVAAGAVTVSASLQNLPAATRQVTVTSEAAGPGEPGEWDPAVCCPGAVVSAEDKNMCYLAPNTPGCPMTAGDGYCDKDDDQSYATPDDSGWVTGYDDAFERCEGYDGDETPAPGGECDDNQCSQDGGCPYLEEYPECCGTDTAHWVQRIKNPDGSCGYEVGACNLPQEGGVCP